ncbi:MAG: hypothetical protein AAF826_02635 [Pseudomonadota bacterium]
MTRIAVASFLIASPAFAHATGTGHIHALEAGALIALLIAALATPVVLKAVRAKK